MCASFAREVEVMRRYTFGMALRIKELRKARGMTQSQLAELAGVERSQLSKIENEKEPANTRRLAAIASALRVGIEDLFSGERDAESYRASIVALMDVLNDDERQAIIAHAEALAGKKGG